MNQLITSTQKASLSLPRWYYLLFIVVVIALLTGNILLERASEKIVLQNTKVSDSLNSMTHNIHLYHLCLEEYLAHATDINKQKTSNNIAMTHVALKELQGLIEQPEWQQLYAHITPHSSQLSKDVERLFKLGQRRMQSPDLSGIDSPMDDAFDALFSQIMVQLKALNDLFDRAFEEQHASMHVKHSLLLVIELILMLGIWLALLIVDRRRAVLFEDMQNLEAEARNKESQHRTLLEESIADKNMLLKQKEKLKLHFEQSPLGIIEWTTDFEVVMWNASAERIFGYTADEAIGRGAFELILNETLQKEVETTVKELMNDVGGYRSVNHNITKDGRIILCDWYNTSLLDNDGNVIGVSSMVIDITKQSQMEKSHQRLAGMLENSTDFVGITDHKGNMLYINSAGRSITGLTADEPIDQLGMKNFLPKKDLIYLQKEVFPRIAKQGVAVQEDITFLDRQGNEIPTSCVVMLELDEHENITHYMAVARDLREEKQTQAKLEHVQRLESLGVLAGGIAHDFNNILTGILGNTALASHKLEAASPIRNYLQNVEDASQRAADLCKQMLAYSGKGKFIVTVIDFNQMIHDITRLMEVSIDKGVVLKYHLADQLPMVEGDASQLQQVLMNLIINASEAIEGKSGVISIGTGVMSVDASYLKSTSADEATTLPGRYVYIEVSDTGCGMDKNTQKKIFDPFFTTKFTGRGLGMSAILGIVHGHKGSIKCYSEVGHGTTFKVLLPCSNKEALLDNNIKQEIKTVKMTGTVMVVDDEETIRDVAGLMLKEMGFNVLKANDGQEAVSLFRQHHKDIKMILLDMTMPRMDGVEAFREMQGIDSTVKVILSSGYNEQDAMNHFAGKGLAGFIQKPYLPNALQQAVRDISKK